jgi:hypothetical protein
MSTTRDPLTMERLATLVEVYQSLAAWAAAEAELAARSPAHTARDVTAHMDAAHTVCMRYAKLLAEIVKAWDYQDFSVTHLDLGM